MRRFVPATTFATMHTGAVLKQLYPWTIHLFKHFPAQVPAADLARPFRNGQVFSVFLSPGSLVMRNNTRRISPAALGDAQMGNFGVYFVSLLISVTNYVPARL